MPTVIVVELMSELSIFLGMGDRAEGEGCLFCLFVCLLFPSTLWVLFPSFFFILFVSEKGSGYILGGAPLTIKQSEQV